MLGKKALGAAAAQESLFIEDVFSTWLRTGTGADVTVTNNIDMTEGYLLWTKSRSAATDHAVYDSGRGVTKDLVTNSTAAETTQSTGLKAVSGTGYTIGSLAKMNTSSATYVDWVFRKAPKFFDVVTWTGDNNSGRQIPHNLGSVPGMIIVKNLSSTPNWQVYHRSIGASSRLILNLTDAAASTTAWNNTSPTSTYFTLRGTSEVNSVGNDYVAYLFAHNAGGFGEAGDQNVVSCGSFTAIDGVDVSVTLGYEPQYLLVKQSSGAGGAWGLFDNMRGFTANSSGSTGVRLQANSANAESTTLLNQFIPRPTATGFIAGSSLGATTGNTFIYLAIRRGPMKTPTSGTSVFSPNLTSDDLSFITTNFVVDATIGAARQDASTKSVVFDRLRGTQYLLTTVTNAESNAGDTTRFQSNTAVKPNWYGAGVNAVYWSFRRAPGFFDVVCYTGTGVARTVNHNLGVAPELIIVKSRSNTIGWYTYSNFGSSNFKRGSLNSAALGTVPYSGFGLESAPTSTQINYDLSSGGNQSGTSYVAYLFATVLGVSKVGSYTGTGTTQQINCGFTTGARFVLIKRTDSTGDWYVWDTARGIIAGNDPYLLLNSTAAEVTSTDYIDPLSSGFEISSTAPAAINASGGSYIFLAIA